MATANTRNVKSFGVRCPECGAKEAVRIDLNDLAGALSCSECDTEMTVDAAVKAAADNLQRWQAVAKWIRLAGECLATTQTDVE
jgi:hypothetical protein